jgi:hypothetical protein
MFLKLLINFYNAPKSDCRKGIRQGREYKYSLFLAGLKSKDMIKEDFYFSAIGKNYSSCSRLHTNFAVEK